MTRIINILLNYQFNKQGRGKLLFKLNGYRLINLKNHIILENKVFISSQKS